MNVWHRKEYISTGVEKAIYKEVVTKQIISCYGLSRVSRRITRELKSASIVLI